MITACADPKGPEPERARDLWLEMQSNGIEPTPGAYEAIIGALSATKETYLEAFDLFRQMINGSYDAVQAPFTDEATDDAWRYLPSLGTFKALMKGAKRAGDLSRARWVLSEVARLSKNRGIPTTAKSPFHPDEELLSDIFYAYASWRPQFHRDQLRSIDVGSPTALDAIESKLPPPVTDMNQPAASPPPTVKETPPGSRKLPVTHGDACRDAIDLFMQIPAARRGPIVTREGEMGNSFHGIRLTTALVNAYLSVHLAHCWPLSLSRDLWCSTWNSFEERGIGPNTWSYLNVLEQLANRGLKGKNAEIALEWGKSIWNDYTTFGNAHQGIPADIEPQTRDLADEDSTSERLTKLLVSPPQHLAAVGLVPRNIEQIHRAHIRLHAKYGSPYDALAYLEDFHSEYPPRLILDSFATSPEPVLSVRISDRTNLSEPEVPPHLIFKDVAILHHKFVTLEDWKAVGKIKWMMTGWEAALGTRRRWRREQAATRVKRDAPRRELLPDFLPRTTIDGLTSIAKLLPTAFDHHGEVLDEQMRGSLASSAEAQLAYEDYSEEARSQDEPIAAYG